MTFKDSDEGRISLSSEVIWLGIVSVSYLDDVKGTFMFLHSEKLLAIHLAVLLIERLEREHLTVREIIDEYHLKKDLLSVRSGRYRRIQGPSVFADMMQYHASKNFHGLLHEILALHSTVYSGENLVAHADTIFIQLFYSFIPREVGMQSSADSSLSHQVSQNTTVEMNSEVSIIILRILSALLNGRPLDRQEEERIVDEDIRFHQSLHLEEAIQSINKRRFSNRSVSYSWSPERVFHEWIQNPQAFSVFHSIDYHVEGAKRVLPLWHKLASRIYVIFAFVISVLTVALNFGDRATVFERITDGLGVATAMLISVFGLVKLTSEDPNAIRNSLLGIKVLKTAEDVAKECGYHDIEELKYVMSLADYPIRWASDQQTSYLKHSPTGLMTVPGGLTVGQKACWPTYTFNNRLVNGDSPFGMLLSKSSVGTARASRSDVKLPFVGVYATRIKKIL